MTLSIPFQKNDTPLHPKKHHGASLPLRSPAHHPTPPPPPLLTLTLTHHPVERQARWWIHLASQPKYVPPYNFDTHPLMMMIGLLSRRRSRNNERGRGRLWLRGSA